VGRAIGSSLSVVAIGAVLLHTAYKSKTEHASTSGNVSEQHLMPALSMPATDEHGKPGTVTLPQGPWRATQQYFHSYPNAAANDYAACLQIPTRCLALYAVPENYDRSNLHAIIATVPDPLHTRMSMETDRYLDAIQQAAFDSGYELATQWLPWTVKGAAEKASAVFNSLQAVDLEKFPGLLVFRPHFTPYLKSVDALLLVFVVGETPTAGINGFQFEYARGALAAFDGKQQYDLYIAGPNFSGSFLSLSRLLEEAPLPGHVEIRAGSVSNSEYARAMLIELTRNLYSLGPEGRGTHSVNFHGSTLPNASFHQHFLELADKLHLRPNEVAEIMEDETGFSFREKIKSSDPLIYRYPRDIAQLRNNYNDDAFAAAQPESKSIGSVDFSLKDSQTGEDSFPIFSTGHTPASQNAVVQQIVQHLRQSSTRLLSLSATNAFDTLFLANVLARNCPDMRVVLPSADLLFVQQASNGLLSGLMSVSPFPMFPEGRAVTQRLAASKVISDLTTFPSADQVGEFNAVLSLLAPMAINQGQGDGYRQKFGPASNQDFSSAWLLVLSSQGWMPVDLLGQANRELDVNHRSISWFDPRERTTSRQDAMTGMLRIGPAWVALCLMTSAFSFLFFGRLGYLLKNPGARVWSNLCLSDLRKHPTTQQECEILHNRHFCLVSCFASLAGIDGLLLCPLIIFIANKGEVLTLRPGTEAVLLIALSLAFVLCLCAAVGIAFALKPRSPLAIALKLLVIAFAFAADYVWWTCCDNGVTGYMLCFRTLALASPVSPILPLLLVGCGLFALSYFHLRRFTWGDRRRPLLNTSIFDVALGNSFHRIKDRLDLTLLTVSSRGGLTGMFVLLSAAAVLTVALFWLPYGSLGSFERYRFSLLLRVLIAPLALFTLLSFLRFTEAWSLLRAFLVNLNSVILGRYFMHIPEFGSGTGPIWIRGVQLMSLGTAVNSCIALHNLELIQGNHPNRSVEYANKLRAFLGDGQPDSSRLDFIREYQQFRQTANDIAAELCSTVLIDYWRDNQLPFIGSSECDTEHDATSAEQSAKSKEKAASLEAGKNFELRRFTAAVGRIGSLYIASRIADGELTPVPEQKPKSLPTAAYEQACRFVALHYSAYIGYALHQLQNLLICSLVCFVLLVLALNSFSFQSPQAIVHLLTAGLIIGGVVVLIAFAQMERDPILSRLSGTAEGELGKTFWLRALSYGAIPVLTVLSTEFPSIGRFFTAWIQPISAALQ
jgi:hypothetical protein